MNKKISKPTKSKRELKIWNGRGHGWIGKIKYDRWHFYVAAYSVAEAVRIINETCNACITANEIREYYSKCWGRPMDGIEPTEPCLYATEGLSDRNLTKLYPKKRNSR